MALSTLDKVHRLVEFATGEPYGDGEIVTDVIVGYAEPGYGSDDDVIVLGNWNPKRYPRDGEPALTPRENIGPRLAEALERVGAEIQWLDEWAQCQTCWRAVRTQPDSYSWKPSYEFVEDHGPVCADCQIAYGVDALDEYLNDPSKCITWCGPEHVEGFGFVKWEPGDPHTYANGWFPGQDDDPHKILEAIKERHPDADVVFFLDESSQFYIRFSAYVRLPEDEGDE